MRSAQDPSTPSGPLAETSEPRASYVVRVCHGPDAGRVLTVDGATARSYMVGTGTACDLELHDPRVSRLHLSLAPEGALLRLKDLGSRGGTVVSGVRVVDALLSGGELVTIGDTQLRVATGPLGPSPTSAHGPSSGRSIGASFDRPWPGNVRELESVVAHEVALGLDEATDRGAEAPTSTALPRRPDPIATVLAAELPLRRARRIVVRELERRYVEQALARNDGNVTRAAAACGLTRRYFHVLLSEAKPPVP